MKRHEKCSICKHIPDESYAFWSGMGSSGNLPKEASKLEIVGAPFYRESTSHRQTLLKKCPKCGTFYDWRFDYEFLVPTSENEITLTRLDDNEGARREQEVLESIRTAQKSFRSDAEPHMEALRAQRSAQAVHAAADYLLSGQLRGHSVTFALVAAVQALKWLYRHAPESAGINTIHVLLHKVPADDKVAARKVLRLLRNGATETDGVRHLVDSWEKEFRRA